MLLPTIFLVQITSQLLRHWQRDMFRWFALCEICNYIFIRMLMYSLLHFIQIKYQTNSHFQDVYCLSTLFPLRWSFNVIHWNNSTLKRISMDSLFLFFDFETSFSWFIFYIKTYNYQYDTERMYHLDSLFFCKLC